MKDNDNTTNTIILRGKETYVPWKKRLEVMAAAKDAEYTLTISPDQSWKEGQEVGEKLGRVFRVYPDTKTTGPYTIKYYYEISDYKKVMKMIHLTVDAIHAELISECVYPKDCLDIFDQMYLKKSIGGKLLLFQGIQEYRMKPGCRDPNEFINGWMERYKNGVRGGLDDSFKISDLAPLILLQNVHDDYFFAVQQLEQEEKLTFAMITEVLNTFAAKLIRKEKQEGVSKVQGVKSEAYTVSKSDENEVHQVSKPSKERINCSECGTRHWGDCADSWCERCLFRHYGKCPSGKKLMEKLETLEYQKNPERDRRNGKEKEANSVVIDLSNRADRFYLDSGANLHMTNIADLENSTVDHTEVRVASNEKIKLEKVGSLLLKTTKGNEIVVEEVHYHPKISKNLLSVSEIAAKGYVILFGKKDGMIVRQEKLIEDWGRLKSESSATLKIDNGLYKLEGKVVKPSNEVCTIEKEDTALIWHTRLGHLNLQDMKKLQVQGSIPKDVDLNELPFCEACVMGKHRRDPFPKNREKPTEILAVVGSDLGGPFETTGPKGERYYVIFMDLHSKFSFIYFLTKKSEAFEAYKEYEERVWTLFEKRINTLRTDNGGEYLSREFHDHLTRKGTKHEETAPYTPQQNGGNERLNQTLGNSSRSMMIYSKCPKFLWPEAYRCSTFIKNRVPSSANQGMTPFEVWHGKKADLPEMRTFGCDAYAKIPDQMRKKLDPKSKPCKMLGYDENSKAYRLWDIEKQEIIISRDVIFNEKFILPWDRETRAVDGIVDENPFGILDHDDEYEERAGDVDEADAGDIDSDSEDDSDDDENFRPDAVAAIQQEPAEPIQPPARNAAPTRIPRPVRNRMPNSRYDQRIWDCSFAEVMFAKSVVDKKESDLNDADIPSSYKQAMKSCYSNEWSMAMVDEMVSIENNETFELVPRPRNQKIVGSRWVFDTKKDADGKVLRLKARLVVQGFSQRYGIDYVETFSPTLKMRSWKMFLAFANKRGWKIRQCDVATAFLNSTVDTDIYINQPEGFVNTEYPGYVWKLKKSLYGLKQSPRLWFETMDAFMKESGFQRVEGEPCLYFKESKNAGEEVYVAVYVDDILVTGKMEKDMGDFIEKLKRKFKVRDLGELSEQTLSLGMKVVRNYEKKQMFISQPEYTRDMLKMFGMEKCKPARTPMDTGIKLTKQTCPKSEEELNGMKNIPYRAAVGKLIYLSVSSRPDIAYAVGEVSRFVSNPGMDHWDAVKRIFRYLNGTVNYGLLFDASKVNDEDLHAYVDADWAGCVDDRKSKSGFAVFWGGGCVSWKSKFQPVVALSTVEAEYIAACDAGREVAWLKKIAKGLGIEQGTTTIYEDNEGCIANSKNEIESEQMKHVDVKYHWLRDECKKGNIKLVKCKSQDMTADTLTKALVNDKFKQHRDGLGVFDLTVMFEGRC